MKVSPVYATIAFALSILCLVPTLAHGQTAGGVSRDLLAIYERTQSITSEADVTAIARACSQVIPDAKRSRTDRDYAANLFAWALNRRGEMRSEQAAKMVAAGKLAEAGTLDQQAAKDFETAIEYNAENWRTRHNFAISLAMRGDYPRAINEFTAAIELKPDYANSYFNRGELYFELSQYDQAMRDYSRAIELNNQDPQYFNSRGHCRFLQESYADALADYARAAELGSDSASYQTDLADAYQFLGRWEEAATAYRAAVAINNSYARAYQNAAWLMATCPEAKYRNVELALSAAKKAMELNDDPRSARGLDTLAAATAALGDHQQAAKLQRQAMQLADKEERGEMAQRLQLYERGREYLQPTPLSGVAQRPEQTSTRIRAASGVQRPSR